MATNYRRTDLIAAIWDSIIEQNAATQLDQVGVCNFAMRQVLRDLDLRSTKRLAPAVDVFDDIYDASCPADMKGIKIIDLVPQVNRSSNFEIELVPAEEFDRRKAFEKNLVAFNDHDALRKLRVAVVVDSERFTASSLDSLTAGGGTWGASGDATNVRVDNQNFVEGNGSLLWDIGAGGTGKAGIKNSTLTAFDITNYLLQGSIFAFVYIETITALTSFSIEIGSSSSNFYKITVTQTNEANTFTTGWNLLRFDFVNEVTTGTPVATAINFINLYANSATITNSLAWRFDGIIIENGVLNQVLYYSKYGWQDGTTGTWKETSTAANDYVNADTEEFDLIVLRGKMGIGPPPPRLERLHRGQRRCTWKRRPRTSICTPRKRSSSRKPITILIPRHTTT